MTIRATMEEALQRGEKIKDQFLSEVMNSETVHGLLQNELVLKSLTKVMNTKFEVERALRTNLKGFLKAFNVPSRDEISTMERKIHRIENEIDGIHQKIVHAKPAPTAVKKREKAAPVHRHTVKKASKLRKS